MGRSLEDGVREPEKVNRLRMGNRKTSDPLDPDEPHPVIPIPPFHAPRSRSDGGVTLRASL